MEELREHWRESGGGRENGVVLRWKDLASSRNFGRITRFRRQKNANWSQAHKHEINIQRGLTYVVLFFYRIFFFYKELGGRKYFGKFDTETFKENSLIL